MQDDAAMAAGLDDVAMADGLDKLTSGWYGWGEWGTGWDEQGEWGSGWDESNWGEPSPSRLPCKCIAHPTFCDPMVQHTCDIPRTCCGN